MFVLQNVNALLTSQFTRMEIVLLIVNVIVNAIVFHYQMENMLKKELKNVNRLPLKKNARVKTLVFGNVNNCDKNK